MNTDLIMMCNRSEILTEQHLEADLLLLVLTKALLHKSVISIALG